MLYADGAGANPFVSNASVEVALSCCFYALRQNCSKMKIPKCQNAKLKVEFFGNGRFILSVKLLDPVSHDVELISTENKYF